MHSWIGAKFFVARYARRGSAALNSALVFKKNRFCKNGEMISVDILEAAIPVEEKNKFSNNATMTDFLMGKSCQDNVSTADA